MHAEWVWIVAIVSLCLAFLCAVVIALDLAAGHRQHMWIMNVVWPVTALYTGPLGLWAYFKFGRLSSHRAMMEAKNRGEENPGERKSFWLKCSISSTHCGAGCTLGDIAAEWLMFVFPLTLFGRHTYGTWLVDYLFAFLFGIAFQYFTIKPMQGFSPKKALLAALKADALSLSAWQIGMYGWMAIATFLIFGHELRKTNPVFWLMMQIAMCIGFLTSYPVNAWLLKKKIKHAM